MCHGEYHAGKMKYAYNLKQGEVKIQASLSFYRPGTSGMNNVRAPVNLADNQARAATVAAVLA